MILQILIAMVAGWLNRHQQQVIAYLLEENRTLHATLGTRRLRFTDPFDGFLLDKRYLMHDRDTIFTAAFDQCLRDQGVEPVVLPPQSPNLHAHCERFVRSIQEEALNQVICIGEGSLRYTRSQYLTHCHAERNHQGLHNQLIAPEPHRSKQTGRVVHRQRLGGLLRSYYQEAA